MATNGKPTPREWLSQPNDEAWRSMTTAFAVIAPRRSPVRVRLAPLNLAVRRSQQIVSSGVAASGPSGPTVYPIFRGPRIMSQRVGLRRTANPTSLVVFEVAPGRQ